MSRSCSFRSEEKEIQGLTLDSLVDMDVVVADLRWATNLIGEGLGGCLVTQKRNSRRVQSVLSCVACC